MAQQRHGVEMLSRDGKGSELIAIHSNGSAGQSAAAQRHRVGRISRAMDKHSNAWNGVAWRSLAKAKQLNTFD